MSKKIIAVAIAVLMIFSVLSVIQPVNAATPGNVSVFLRPGVEDPYKPGWSQTLGTLRLHPEVVTASYLNYAILASTESSPSIGDLQFDVTISSIYTGALYIYLPPEFTLLAPDGSESTDLRYNVWTDITNDYNYISVGVRGAWDPGCPFCTRIRIGFTTWYPDNDPLSGVGVTLDPGTYHVRIFNVKAPTVAGVYHFKMRLYPDYFSPNDFPIIIVKSELNPAYIVGQVGLCANGSPCTVTDTTKYGKVWAEGTTPEGRSVSAAYYFGPEDASSGLYTYWLFGVAPGTYSMYASAGGYPKSAGERVEIVAGQSMHLKTMWLMPGPNVQVTVWSKHGRGALPWGSLWQPPYGTNDPTVVDLNRPRPISFDLYDADGNHLVWGCSGSLECGPSTLTDPTATSFTATIGPDIGYTSRAPIGDFGGANVDGFTSGVTYKIETWVTGYVMTEQDAWQRQFTVSGGAVNVEMDLRRSNYFEITLHEIPLPSVPTSLMLAAEQDGVEKGINSLLVAQNGDLWFWDSGYAAYGPQVNPNTGLNYNINTDPIILEGWSYRYLYDYTMDDLAWRDYGFEPGTYEIKMYMADMGDTTGKWSSLGVQGYTGQVVGNGWYTINENDSHSGSIALCNSPSAISFRARVNSLWLKIRSVDWQSPAHTRPWLFPGAEVWVDILDENDNVVESIANDLWGVVQDDGSIGSFYACFNQDSGSWAVCPFPGEGYILTVPFTGNDYGQNWGYGPDIFGSGAYPTSLPAGQYKYSVHTYGYVERRNFPNVFPLGGKADIQVDLIQGGQIRVNMNFYKEHVLLAAPTDFDGYVRVEVFNENDELVGASIYGQAQVNPLAPGSYLLYDSSRDWKYWNAVFGYLPEAAEGAGVDLIAPDGTPGYGQRAYTSQYFYGLPVTTFAQYYALNPVYAHRLSVPPDGTAAFDVFGFYWYYGGKSSRNDGLWANGFDTVSTGDSDGYGLRGSSDGTGITGGGLYKVKVWAFEPGPTWASYYMVSDIAGVEVPWGGATELYVDLEQMGRLTGSIGWSDMYGNLQAMPWLQLTASSSQATVVAYSTPMVFDPTTSLAFSTLEPAYMMWLPGPSDTLYTVSAQATVAPQALAMPIAPPDISISPGFEASADLAVGPTGVPIPEFPVAPLVALSALAASLYVLKRRRK